MIQLLIIYFFPGLVLHNPIWGGGETGRFLAASVSFILNYACYFSEIYRGGIQSVPVGQEEAGLVAAALYPKDENWNFEKIHDYCYERGFTIYPGKVEKKGMFRLCALGAIDEADITAFFEVFRQGLNEYGVSIPVKY